MILQKYIDKRKAFFTRRTSADYKLTGDDILRGRKPEEKKSISTLTQAKLFTRHLKMFKHVDPKPKKDFHYPIIKSKLKTRDELKFSPVVYEDKKPTEDIKSISTLTLKDIKARHTNKNNITIRYVEVPNAKLRTEFISLKKAIQMKQSKE